MSSPLRLPWFLILVLGLGPGVPARSQETGSEPVEPKILGAPSAFDLGDPTETVTLDAETPIHQRPADRSAILTRLDFAAEVPVLERQGDWARVRWDMVGGWVRLAGEPEDGDPEDGERVARAPRTAESSASAATATSPWIRLGGPDPARVERALLHLGPERTTRPFGPYTLHTDVANPRRLEDLAGLAEQLPEVFRQRFGLAATPATGETVVLYARAKSFQTYLEGEGDVTVLDTPGRAVEGLAVLHAEERLPGEQRSVLIHELAHLLSYSALGQNLPPWLAEGLAEDLAFCRVSRAGQILPGTLGSWEVSRTVPVMVRGQLQMGVERVSGGPRLALRDLLSRRSSSERPSPAELLALPRDEFLAPEHRSLHYAMSAFWVRFLLAGELAEPFQAFLKRVARGDEVAGESLRARLGKSWQQLEDDWHRWLRGNGPYREAPR